MRCVLQRPCFFILFAGTLEYELHGNPEGHIEMRILGIDPGWELAFNGRLSKKANWERPFRDETQPYHPSSI